MPPDPPFPGGLASPAAGNAAIRHAQLPSSSGLASAAESWVAQGHTLPVGMKCCIHWGRHKGWVSSVRRETTVMIIVVPVFPVGSIVGPPFSLCPVLFPSSPPLRGWFQGHSATNILSLNSSQSASWEAHAVPALSSPFFLMTALQRLAEQPACTTTQPLAWLWCLGTPPSWGALSGASEFTVPGPGDGWFSGSKPETLGPSH